MSLALGISFELPIVMVALTGGARRGHSTEFLETANTAPRRW
jgi:hypothetical protein